MAKNNRDGEIDMANLRRAGRLFVLSMWVIMVASVIALITLAVSSYSARAQSGAIDYKESITGASPIIIGRAVTEVETITFGSDGIRGNWNVISKCAWKVYPRPPREGEVGYNDMTSPGWRAYSNAYQQISLCRWILAAYAAGWRDSGTTGPNPYPPVPSMVPGDFEELAK